jgi:hypothetical protein
MPGTAGRVPIGPTQTPKKTSGFVDFATGSGKYKKWDDRIGCCVGWTVSITALAVVVLSFMGLINVSAITTWICVGIVVLPLVFKLIDRL